MSVYQFLPPLTVEERAALRESIATFGILQPVITDEAGAILDGHHRAEIAVELGIAYPRTVPPGLSEEQKIEQAVLLNLGRRHLDREQRRALVQDLRGRGLSIRWISERTAIPRSTVARLAESPVPFGTPEYVTGRDGKSYRAYEPEGQRFRADMAAAGCANADELPVTVDEFRRFLTQPPLEGLADSPLIGELTDEQWRDALLSFLERQVAKIYLWSREAPFPEHLYAHLPPEVRGKWHQAWVEVMVPVHIGRFFNWLAERDLLDESGDRVGVHWDRLWQRPPEDIGHVFCTWVPRAMWPVAEAAS